MPTSISYLPSEFLLYRYIFKKKTTTSECHSRENPWSQNSALPFNECFTCLKKIHDQTKQHAVWTFLKLLWCKFEKLILLNKKNQKTKTNKKKTTNQPHHILVEMMPRIYRSIPWCKEFRMHGDHSFVFMDVKCSEPCSAAFSHSLHVKEKWLRRISSGC